MFVYIFGKIDLISMHSTKKVFYNVSFNDFQEAFYNGHWTYGRIWHRWTLSLTESKTVCKKMG